MELIQLKIVKAICDTGSLSKASARLGRARSIVSRHLTTFESECGGRLFRRTGRGLELTELGEQIMPEIDLTLATVARMVGWGKSSLNTITGNVHVGVNPALREQFAPMLLSTIKQQYPLITLQLSEGSSSAAIDHSLETGKIDIAVNFGYGAVRCAYHEVICNLDPYLLSLPGNALPGAERVARKEIGFSDLAGLPLLLPSQPESARHLVTALAESRGISLSLAAEVNSSATMRSLFERGAGYIITAGGIGRGMNINYLDEQVAQGRVRATLIRDSALRSALLVATAPSPANRVEVVRKSVVRILRELSGADMHEPVRVLRTAIARK